MRILWRLCAGACPEPRSPQARSGSRAPLHENRTRLYDSGLAILILTASQIAGATEQPAPGEAVRVNVAYAGKRVVDGFLAQDAFVFVTDIAGLSIKIDRLWGISRFGPDGRQHATLRNGDVAAGRISTDTFMIRTTDDRAERIPVSNLTALVVRNDDAALPDRLRDGIILHYKFDLPGETVVDWSGHGHHGTASSDLWIADGKVGSAFRFQSHDTIVQTPPSETLDTISNAVTLSAWFRADSLSTKHWRMLAGNGGKNCFKNGGFYLFQGGAKNGPTIHWAIGNGRTEGMQVHTGYGSIAPRQWHHIVGRYGRGQPEVFLDGSNVSRFAWGIYRGRIANSVEPFRVGHLGPENTDYRKMGWFHGRMDEVILYNRALSDAEIQLLHQAQR